MGDAMARAAYIRALRSLRVRYYGLHNDEGDRITVAVLEPLLNNILQAFDQTTAGFDGADRYRLMLTADLDMVRLSLQLQELQEPLFQIHIKLFQMTSN
jgi:hypothetical protein